MVTGLHVAAWVLALSSGCSLAAEVDHVSLLQVALKVGTFEPEKVAPSSPRLEDPLTWPPMEPWLEDWVREKLRKGEFRDPSGPQSNETIIVYPPAKLAFCWIPKIASTAFNSLMNHLNGRRITGPNWTSFVASSPDALKLQLADASRKKGWKWAVFLRDPLSRFLSAWGDKCVLWATDHTVACWPKGSFSNHTLGTAASVADFHRHVLKAWSAYLRGETRDNLHWRPQQEFCHGLNDAKDYDLVGHLSGDVHAQVRSMLEMVGAPTGDLEQFFPKAGRAGHATMLDPNLYYSNATLRWMVGEMYKRDYNLPGLGEPPKKP